MNPYRLTYLLSLILLMLTSCGSDSGTASSLMDELEQAIKDRPVYAKQREDRISQLKDELWKQSADSMKFDIYAKLLDEYKCYNVDSALSYASRRLDMSRKLGRPELVTHARLDEAEVLQSSGMYVEALDILRSIPRDSVPDYLSWFYGHLTRNIYSKLTDYTLRAADKARYQAVVDSFTQDYIKTLDPGSLTYALVVADRNNKAGRFAESVKLLEPYVGNDKYTVHEQAICACVLGFAYKGVGDMAKAKECFTRSAISDMRSAVKDHMSITQLAMILYEEGDFKCAHEFLQLSLGDAIQSNSQQRLAEIRLVLPEITAVYYESLHDRQRVQNGFIIAISVMLLVLAVAAVLLRRQERCARVAAKALERANKKMRRLNDNLNKSNADLKDANHEIAENAYIKEEYIARYMDICSAYIEKYDSQRKHWLKLLTGRKFDELHDELKSTEMVNDELRQFYENFDATFLHLFPTFVEDFNMLLNEDSQYVPKADGTLNTEMRIFALIRLGISDSVKIAQFLRVSVSTVYNYRTRVRGRAVGDRDKVEDELMKIGAQAYSEV